MQLPVVTYLRNPALKQRHWIKIEIVLNHKFKPDVPVTLELLENLKVFSYPNELLEISGQASSEAGLESLLRKVQELFFLLKKLAKCYIFIYISILTNTVFLWRFSEHGEFISDAMSITTMLLYVSCIIAYITIMELVPFVPRYIESSVENEKAKIYWKSDILHY